MTTTRSRVLVVWTEESCLGGIEDVGMNVGGLSSREWGKRRDNDHIWRDWAV